MARQSLCRVVKHPRHRDDGGALRRVDRMATMGEGEKKKEKERRKRENCSSRVHSHRQKNDLKKAHKR